MTWITPKTDWKSSDYINVNDWARIESNIKFLGELFNVTLEPLVLDRAVTGFPYARYLNYLATSVLVLPSGYITPVGWQVLKTDWQALDSINNTVINNFESNLSLLKCTHDKNSNQHNYLGEIYFGEKGGLL